MLGLLRLRMRNRARTHVFCRPPDPVRRCNLGFEPGLDIGRTPHSRGSGAASSLAVSRAAIRRVTNRATSKSNSSPSLFALAAQSRRQAELASPRTQSAVPDRSRLQTRGRGENKLRATPIRSQANEQNQHLLQGSLSARTHQRLRERLALICMLRGPRLDIRYDRSVNSPSLSRRREGEARPTLRQRRRAIQKGRPRR